MIGKLRNRSRVELQDRLAQFAWNRLDKLGLIPSAVLHHLGTGIPHTPWPAVDAAAIIGRLNPVESGALLARADRLLANRFDILGFEALSFGTPPDWQLDPLSGKRARRVHWTKVPYLDDAAVVTTRLFGRSVAISGSSFLAKLGCSLAMIATFRMQRCC